MKNRLCERGVTLVEVLISLVILLIVFMGLLQASLLSIDHNVRNAVRDEAVKIASDEMTIARSIPFDNAAIADTGGGFVTLPAPPFLSPATGDPLDTVRRSFRSQSQLYTIAGQVADLDANNKQITIRVTYQYRGEPVVTHTINSTVRR